MPEPLIPALEGVELADLDEKGKTPTPSRLTSPATLRGLYEDLLKDNEGTVQAMTKIQAVKDGQPPFNQAARIAAGLGSTTNANFLMMQDLVNKANSGYNDIVTSPKTLMTVEVEIGEASENIEYSRIIATELTRTIRKWPGFTSSFLRLVDLFVTHGVGIEYSSDPFDFRFEVCSLADMLIPRQVKASEEKIPYAIARNEITVTDLYGYIKNPETAAKMGWNVDAVNAAISRATTSTTNHELGDLAKVQQQIKNNDVTVDRQFKHVKVLNGWVREFNGSISFFITEKDAKEGDFLFKSHAYYTDVAEAFNFYCYGIGNGTFHGIRGMGHMIFPLVQLHNRLMSQKADGVILDETLLVQATSSNALQNAAVNQLGPFSLMSEGFDVVDRKLSGGSEKTLPYLDVVVGQMNQSSSRFSAKSSGDAYKSKDEFSAELEQVASNDSGAIDLFYASWDRTIRKMCRRIIKGPKTDPLVAEFHRRVEKAGITKEILDAVDHDSTYAYRSLGAGSPAARSIGFKRLLELLPQLDEIGRKNLIYDFVANIMGYQNAERYASESPVPRLGPEAGQAELENALLIQGSGINVLPYQMHGTHVQIHIPLVLDVLDKVETGQLDPMENLPGLQASLDHIAAHGEELAQDPTQAALYGQVKEAVNNLQQVVTNMDRKIKAAERKASESGQGMEQGSSDMETVNAQLLAEKKLALEDFKLQLAMRKGELELATLQAKAQQNLALNDLKAATQAQTQMRFPASSAATRR